MELRNLGKTGLKVSAIGLGTVKFGRNQSVKYPEAFELPTDKKIDALLALCQELGINLLDTAPAYGTSEERLGKAIKGSREQWIICSKAGEEFDGKQSYFDFSSQAIIKSVERSLTRLKTDYLDCLLIHSDGQDEKIILKDQALQTLDQLKNEGKIRATGMSTKTISGGLLALHHADVVMATYHAGYLDEKIILDEAAHLEKGILIKKALQSGHLVSNTQQQLKFILEHPAVSSIIVGTLNETHLRTNCLE